MIYTITCQRARNYGAVLQPYALAEFLKKNNNVVKVIDYKPKYLNQSLTSKNFVFNLVRSIIQFPDRYKGNRVFGTFLDRYVPLTTESYSSCSDMEQRLPPAKIYIAGSDQIWNMNCPNGYDDSYFLKFADGHGRKVAYAASFAMEELSDLQKERVESLTKDFYAVSIRENSGTELFKKATNRKAITVADPVFLLSASEWSKLASEKYSKDKYVLVYAFYRQKEVFQYAKRLAEKEKCKVYFVNTAYLDCIMPCNKYLWCVSPNDFIALIKNAESVVTNSFHGLSFSLIFHKDVHVFYPPRKGNSRLEDILKLTGLINRVVRDNKIIKENIDYRQVDRNLQLFMENSKKFLIETLVEKV